MSGVWTSAARTADWPTAYRRRLPSLKPQSRRYLDPNPLADRDEVQQFSLASAAIAVARRAEQERLELARPTPLVRYGLRPYRAGRLIGGATSAGDAISSRG